jgi:hypothetical protein
MPMISDYETTEIDGVAWIVRLMPDGSRRRVGRAADLRRTLDELAEDASLTTREAEQDALNRESAASVQLSIARYGGGDGE